MPEVFTETKNSPQIDMLQNAVELMDLSQEQIISLGSAAVRSLRAGETIKETMTQLEDYIEVMLGDNKSAESLIGAIFLKALVYFEVEDIARTVGELDVAIMYAEGMNYFKYADGFTMFQQYILENYS